MVELLQVNLIMDFQMEMVNILIKNNKYKEDGKKEYL